MKRTPIKRVSSKRSAQLREYSRLRKEYLEKHKYCQAFMKINGIDEAEVIAKGGRYTAHPFRWEREVPLATDIHHVGHRYGSRLNDTSKWLAISREFHERIHAEPSWARENGLLDNY